jgi:hypothetical protein
MIFNAPETTLVWLGEAANDGIQFTSKSQGFMAESSKNIKPKDLKNIAISHRSQIFQYDNWMQSLNILQLTSA